MNLDEPRCGRCGKAMTPEDSKVRPELFLHDRCLPDELKPKTDKCQHTAFDCECVVNRMIDTGRYSLDVKVTCKECNLPFRFIGLPTGLDLNGAAVSVDGIEGRFAIAPKGQVVTPLESTASGFTIRRTE